MKHKWYFWAPLALLAFVVFIFIGGQVVMLLWNWLLPPLFGWHAVTYWQALGILALSRILFGGFGMHGGSRHKMRRGMAEHWEHMTPEEREKFRQGIGSSGSETKP